jgi:hypothetical protein
VDAVHRDQNATRMTDGEHGSYAVVWEEGGGRRYTGRLDILEAGVHLEGRSTRDRWRSRHIAFSQLRGVRVGRTEAERIDGRRSLVLDLSGSHPMRILALGGTHLLSELTDLLADPRRTSAR